MVQFFQLLFKGISSNEQMGTPKDKNLNTLELSMVLFGVDKNS